VEGNLNIDFNKRFLKTMTEFILALCIVPLILQDQDLIALTHFLYRITKPETPESTVHNVCDINDGSLAYTIDEKPAMASTRSKKHRAAAAARLLPSEENKKLINRLLRQHLNQNIYYDENYDLSNLSNNSYSSLSLNSAGMSM
jgi:hypothetical protein